MPFLIARTVNGLEAASLTLVVLGPKSGIKGDEIGSMLEISSSDRLRELKNPENCRYRKEGPKFLIEEISDILLGKANWPP